MADRSNINRFGGRITLITGGLVMATAYIAQVFLPGNLTAVVGGSTLVGIGTAIGYAAMPTLIMASVPITATASANGVNTLMRAIGTSISSAAVVAILGSVTITVGALTAPAFQAFQDVFWMAAIAALLGCAVAWFIPRRVAVTALGVEPAPVRVSAGDNRDVVLHGRIRDTTGGAPYPAVVTVITISGDPVDWSRTDRDGTYSIALPGAGSYLVTANAQGWSPTSQVITLADPSALTAMHEITLTEQLTLSGRVTRAAAPVPRALVSLGEAAGPLVTSVTADDTGRWSIPVPPPGRYMVVVLIPGTNAAAARKIVLDARSTIVDVDINSG